MTTPDTRAVDVGELQKQAAPAVELEFRVFFSEQAFDRAIERGGQDLTREVGGVLVGRVCRDDGGAYVHVDTTIDALHADEQGTEVTFTHETWDHVHKEMDAHHRGKSIVGWYHTHPGFGIFLSDRDQFIQRSFFNLPHQVALVYDPKSREHGVFAWRDGEPVRWPRYWVGRRLYATERSAAAPARPAPAVPTVVAPAGSLAEPSTQTDERPTRLGGVHPGDLALGAVVVLLLGGLAGWWFGSGRAPGSGGASGNELERARLEGAALAMENVNAQVVTALRLALGGAERVKPLERAFTSLSLADQALRSDPPDPAAALESVTRAASEVRTFSDTHVRLESLLLSMEQTQRADSIDPREVRRLASKHAAVLGQICAELAEVIAKGGDNERAARLRSMAQMVDPSGRHGTGPPPDRQETPR